MLLPEKMYKAIVVTPKSYTDVMLSELQKYGIAQIDEIHKFLRDIRPGEPMEYFRELSNYELMLSRIIESFEKYIPKPGGIKNLIKPVPPKFFKTKRMSVNEILDECSKYIPEISRIIENLDGKVKDLSEKIGEIETTMVHIQEIPFEEVDLKYIRSGEFYVANIVRITDIDKFKHIAQKYNIVYAIKEVVEKKESKYYAVVISTKKSWDKFTQEIPPGVFTIIKIPKDAEGTKKEYINMLQQKIEKIREEIEKTKAKILEVYKKHEENLKILYDAVRIEKDKRITTGMCGESLYTNIFAFWVPESKVDLFKRIVSKTTEGKSVISLEEAKIGEDAPILLNNPKWAKPFEFLTRLFSLPKYGKVDPTIIIGPIFAIYYGIMLGDFLYGFLVFLAGLLLIRGLGRYQQSIKDFGIVMASAGFFSMVVGIIQGSYFGDAIQKFLGYNVPTIYDPFSDPMKLLVLALYIGLFQLNLGMALSSYQLIREGKIKEFVCDRVSWFLLQPAGAILILKYLFGREFSPLILNIALIVALIGLGLIFLEHKGLGFFELTGFIGEWLSYTRILALDLATSGTAMTINIIAALIASPSPILIPFAFLIWFGGHLINAVLQNLGSFVHSLRLQYVEFFGKFYESGGSEFTPFAERRKYTIVEGGDNQ
ncbi:MAG TPA: V-type ATP synthase subunit I [Euryarchaeota archaeon]|nr:V-type ATP synthase subunit I [Euryarchaeota archaeon]